jgi:hypothetical protein
MSFRDFCADNLMFGTTLIAQSFQMKVKKGLSPDSHWSFIGSLILIALYVEGGVEGLRPSVLAKMIGLGTRPHVETAVLVKLGYVRKVQDKNARETILFLTSVGEKKALEMLTAYQKLQDWVNHSMGPEKARELNGDLISIHEMLNKKASSTKMEKLKDMVTFND